MIVQPPFHSPIDRTEYNPAVYSPGAQPLTQTQLLSPSPITSAIYDQPQFPPTPPPPRIISPMQKENSVPESPKNGKDIVWLIQTLRYDGGASRDEKKKAIAELKRLAKSASEDYWKRNCAQV